MRRFGAYRLEECGGGKPKDRMTKIGIDDLDDGILAPFGGAAGSAFPDTFPFDGFGSASAR